MTIKVSFFLSELRRYWWVLNKILEWNASHLTRVVVAAVGKLDHKRIDVVGCFRSIKTRGKTI